MREQTFEFLSLVLQLAGNLGVEALVFGSPKNRQVGNVPRDEARNIAVDFFRRLGREALRAAVGCAALTGSSRPLATLHVQSGVLLGGGADALSARLRSLRGQPVVLNEWASVVLPLPRRVPALRAGVGALRQARRVPGRRRQRRRRRRARLPAQPSGELSELRRFGGGERSAFGTAAGLPTTIYLGPDGRRLHTHTGQYAAPQALDADIERYALGT